jgi:hypothetical protein
VAEEIVVPPLTVVQEEPVAVMPGTLVLELKPTAAEP